jgi:hypothetical protein
MRVSEKKRLRKAIGLLMTDNWEDGMKILCSLADMVRPLDDFLSEAKHVSVQEVAKRENSSSEGKLIEAERRGFRIAKCDGEGEA